MIKGPHATLERNLDDDPPVSTARKARGLDADRREAILDSAEAVFLEEGFQAASMSAIAARVGGSKGTLYNYFPSKEDLFLACVARHCAGVRQQMSSLASQSDDLRETLTMVGRRYVEMVSSDALVSRLRLIVAEVERSPNLGKQFYEMGPAQGSAVLGDHIARAMERGELARGDPRRAADQFLGLCYSNRVSKARLLNAQPAPDAETIARDVDDAVRIFMAGYAPNA